ncbi:MAG: hypothetical protein AAF937_03030 [Planctomycetota bacterium]
MKSSEHSRSVDGTPLRVGWVFGLARTGTSITAYAAAHAADAAVADEILGPWDRTGPPYDYPTEQAEIVEQFKASHARLTPPIVDRTRALLATIARERQTTSIVSKHPHLRFTPPEFAAAFPDHRGVWVIRNPLRRLASIHARGWTSIIRPNHDFDYFREYAERWLALPDQQKVVFEDVRKDPKRYFGRVFDAWGWPNDAPTRERAVAYQRAEYHGKSGERESGRSTRRSLSETKRLAPPEAVSLYLGDPFMRDLFARCGWELNRKSYLPTAMHRIGDRLKALAIGTPPS